MSYYSSIASAKINLFLHIVAKLPSGYHELQSLVVFADNIGDLISVEESNEIELFVTGEFANDLEYNCPDYRDNLVYKAVLAVQSHFGVDGKNGVKITIDKRLPIASGIGGGSADAAAAANLIVKLWGIKTNNKELGEILLPLGADIPMCLESKSLLASGIGDRITRLEYELPNLYVLLFNPLKKIPTKEVFSSLSISDDIANKQDVNTIFKFNTLRIKKWESTEEFCSFLLKNTKNDLEDIAISILPEIRDTLMDMKSLDGCLISRMSGSGASCFGLFDDLDLAENALKYMNNSYIDSWCMLSPLKIA